MTIADLVHFRAEITEELDGLGRISDLLAQRLTREQDATVQRIPDAISLRGIAGMLQDYYTGAERIFRRVAIGIDDRLPKGESWHKDLLSQMKREIPGLRPALLSEPSFAKLDELRTFRHVVSNIYGYNLIPERVLYFSRGLSAIHRMFREDISRFLRVLEEESEKNIRPTQGVSEDQ